MTLKSKLLGKSGEQKAKKFLKNKGYLELGQNLRLFCGEIDLLMQEGKTLVIVEVKTKSDQSYGKASEMITPAKKRKLLQLGRALYQKFPDANIRIDVIAIDHYNNIEHIISAVEE